MMTPLLMLLVLAPIERSLPEMKLQVQDPRSATAVTDKRLIAPRLPDCRNDAEVQKTLVELRQGGQGQCFIRDVKAFSQR